MGKLENAVSRFRERSQKQGSYIPFYKFPSGRSDLRILPAATGEDKDEWFLSIGLHYGVTDKIPVYCPFEHENAQEPCALCDMVAQLRNQGMNDEAGKIAVRRRALVRAVVRGQEEKGVQLVNLPSTVFLAISEIVADEETFGPVLSPGPKGRDIRITKTGQNLDTEYTVQALPSQRSLLPTADATKELIQTLTPIAEIAEVPTSANVAQIVRDKFGYESFGENLEEPDDEQWEQGTSDDPDTPEEDYVEDEDLSDHQDADWGDDVPFGDAPEDNTWLDDPNEVIPDLSALAAADQAKAKKSLTAELSKKHTVKTKGK